MSRARAIEADTVFYLSNCTNLIGLYYLSKKTKRGCVTSYKASCMTTVNTYVSAIPAKLARQSARAGYGRPITPNVSYSDNH